MYFLKKYRRGIKNRYRHDMYLHDMIVKDIQYLWRQGVNYIRNGFKHKYILAWPHYPSSHSTLHRFCKQLGYNLTNDPTVDHEAVVYYEYATYRDEYPFLEKYRGKLPVINFNSRNTGKEFIDQVHLQVFGYNTELDPLTHQGPAVVKSFINARHDGNVVECPLDRKEDHLLYQKLINNVCPNGDLQDIRVYILNYTIPMLVIRNCKPDRRFRFPYYSYVARPDDYLTPEEQEKIIEFCRVIGFEMGELDALRDNDDGRIYLVDANNTPHGAGSDMSKTDKINGYKLLAELFQKEYLNGRY